MTFVRPQTIRGALLGVVILLGVGLWHRSYIRPMEQRRVQTLGQWEQVQERLWSAEGEIRAIKQRRLQGMETLQNLRSIHEHQPPGPAMVWLPPRLKTTLGNLGVSDVSVRLNKVAPEPLLRGFERTYWLLSVPAQAETRKFTDVLLAVAQIEQQDNFVQIEGLSLHLQPEQPGRTTGCVSVTTLVPKHNTLPFHDRFKRSGAPGEVLADAEDDEGGGFDHRAIADTLRHRRVIGADKARIPGRSPE